MFERFTKDARGSVTHAQDEARRLGADRIDSAHLLLGAVADPGSVAARALATLGVDHDGLVAAVRGLPHRSLDADALAGVGIDLESVRAQVEATFGPGALDEPAETRGRKHLPFENDAKKALQVALREAIRFSTNRIDTGHVLLGIARLDGAPGQRALASVGHGRRDELERAVVAAWADSPAA
jgi:ATP-dependent Clp protease ATP-binding subunit ClpA